MSKALVQFLIAVADPVLFEQYQEDKDRVMAHFNLTRGDRLAVLSGKPGRIRYQAKLTDDVAELPQNAADYIGESLTLDQVEVDVELHVDVTDVGQTAIGRDLLLYDDTAGKLYRAVPETSGERP